MRYTQGQIRELLSIPVETFRAWRSALPTLGRHRGHGPTFTPGDLVAVAIVSELVQVFGLRIGAVASRLNPPLAACHGLSWPALEECWLVLEAEGGRLVEADGVALRHDGKPSFIIGCAAIIERLRDRLAEAELEAVQTSLPFPPAVVVGARG